MVGLCKIGNEPPGSLKVNSFIKKSARYNPIELIYYYNLVDFFLSYLIHNIVYF